MDTIIKQISVRANYNELIFDSSMAGFDYLDVSLRSFQIIDFRITDSYGKGINLQISHWSCSVIFQKPVKDIQLLLILHVLNRIITIV